MRPTPIFQTCTYTSPVGRFTVTRRSLPAASFTGVTRKRIEIVHRVPLLLPAVRVQILPEISLLVEQAEADERIILVAAGFEVVAGEDSKTAGIYRQTLRQSVFRGEIGDQLSIKGIALVRARIVGLARHAVNAR